MVSMAVPIKVGDHTAETVGHEPKRARARAIPAGALAWSAYVRVVISSCAFVLFPDGQGIAKSEDMASRGRWSRQTIF